MIETKEENRFKPICVSDEKIHKMEAKTQLTILKSISNLESQKMMALPSSGLMQRVDYISNDGRISNLNNYQ